MPPVFLIDDTMSNQQAARSLYFLTISLLFGILFSPFSYGIVYLLLWIGFYECIIALLTHLDRKYYHSGTRLVCFCSSVLGFIVGRTLLDTDENYILFSGIDVE